MFLMYTVFYRTVMGLVLESAATASLRFSRREREKVKDVKSWVPVVQVWPVLSVPELSCLTCTQKHSCSCQRPRLPPPPPLTPSYLPSYESPRWNNVTHDVNRSVGCFYGSVDSPELKHTHLVLVPVMHTLHTSPNVYFLSFGKNVLTEMFTQGLFF